MRQYAIIGLCLVGGLAWAGFLFFAPSAHLVASLPVIGLAKTELPATQWQPPLPEPKPAGQSAVLAAVNADAIIIELPAPQIELKSGKDLTADIKTAAAQTAAQPEVTASIAKPIVQADKRVELPAPPAEPRSGEDLTADIKAAAAQTPAQPEATASIAKPVVQAALEPAVKSGDVAAPPAVAAPQVAQGCPGNPDALGVSRVLTVRPGEFSLLGTIQYKQTLPLKDHEVVLTFDDGPIPPYTTSILDTLAANCVKATYFLVGEMAHARPYLVRRIYNEGHTIGTHSQNHPFGFERLSMDRVQRQVDGGINSVDGALGDPKALSPFFRIPGFGRTTAIEHFLESKGLVTWSADVDTDDWWRGSTPRAIVERAMRRLNAKGRGIILMHDIHPATALALPMLLKQLKASGYHVVQVVAAGDRPKSLPDVMATTAEKRVWPPLLHADAEKGGPIKVALRHRVKLTLSHRRHHRVAERRETGEIDYKATSSLDRRPTRSY